MQDLLYFSHNGFVIWEGFVSRKISLLFYLFVEVIIYCRESLFTSSIYYIIYCGIICFQGFTINCYTGGLLLMHPLSICVQSQDLRLHTMLSVGRMKM